MLFNFVPDHDAPLPSFVGPDDPVNGDNGDCEAQQIIN